jgi:hypothetical protein
MLRLQTDPIGGEIQMLKNAAIVPYIPAANVARAREFYEEKVGLNISTWPSLPNLHAMKQPS